jgi:hypothetical protein
MRARRERTASAGLAIRESEIHNVLTDIEVTNPRDQDRGRVIFDHQGLLAWDYLPKNLDEATARKIADIITTLLTTNITQQVSSEPNSAPPSV